MKTSSILLRFRKFWFLPLAIVAGIGLSAPVFSQPQMLTSGLPGSEKFYKPEELASYYASHAMNPIWVRGTGSFQPRIEAITKILEESWTHGLNPDKYRLDEIKALSKNLTAENRMELDMVVTDAVVRYGHDLTGMRGGSPGDKQIKYWRQPYETAQLLELIGDSGDPVSKIRGLEPNNALYESLRKELVRLASAPASESAPVKISGIVKPGRVYSQIPAIRAKMGLPEASANADFYDDTLASAVMKLQRSYGLDTDGVIGPKTLELINITNEDKMWQIIANMERLRWIDQSRPERYVLVNIPSANLWAVDGGEVKLEMPVIVGKTARPTYSFKTEITGVRFNPNWTVPPTIKSKDFLPLLRNNPNALNEKGIRLIANGRTIDPNDVDWNSVGSRQLHSFSMVQNPGDDNPLGKVRVIMENPYNIYLHDTNHRDLFDKTERNLSSGCIRVSQPQKLADFLLSHNESWDQEKTQKAIDSGRMQDIKVDQTIPVFITYQTIWLDTDGRLIYGRDVYGQDKKLAEMLKKSGAARIPQTSENSEISL